MNRRLIAVILPFIVVLHHAAQGATIEEAVQSALANNPEVSGKEYEVVAAQENAAGVRSERLPSVSSELGSDAQGNTSSTVVARQILYSFDRVKRSIGHADAEVGRQEAELLVVRRMMAESTALAYLDVLAAGRRSVLAHDFVTEMQDLTASVGRRVTAGLASEADLRLGEIRLTEAQSRLVNAETEEARAIDLLESFAVMDVDRFEPISDALLELPATDDLVEQVLDQSAELRAKHAALDSAVASLALEKRAAMPSLYGELRKDLSSDADARIGLFLSYQMDGLGKTQGARVRGGTARLDASRRDMEATDRRVQFEVSQLLSQIEVQTALISSQDAMLVAVDGAVDSNERLFTAGKVPWSEVLNIYRERHEKRMDRVGLDRDLTAARLQLAVMIGRLDLQE